MFQWFWRWMTTSRCVVH